MATREIIELGDPRLRKRSRSINNITPDIRQLVDDMVETMHANNGIGLAAVQVGKRANHSCDRRSPEKVSGTFFRQPALVDHTHGRKKIPDTFSVPEFCTVI